jgi:nucleoside-diphosphate-sugar epimerase
VVALVRPRADRRALDGLAIDVREGDILDRASLAAAFDGADVVMHAAAPHRNFAADPSEITRPAVDGTRNVLDACAQAKVRRMVLTSSGATIGFAKDAKAPLDERHHVGDAKAPYIRAKVEQEKVALADDRVEVVVLNPSGVVGPGDYRITPATRAFVGLLQGDPAFMTLSLTDVRDVAHAHAVAAVRGKARERYLITGDVLGPKELSAAFTKALGFGPKVMTPPRFLVGWLAWWQERKARSSGTDASITRAMLDDAWGRHLAYDSTKSRNELGMTYRPAVDVIRDAATWLLARDALKPSVANRVRSRNGMASRQD